MARPIVILHPNPDSVARDGAEHFVKIGIEAIAARGKFLVALSGGTTPKAMYEYLLQQQYKDAIDWSVVHIFWSDERFVPYDHSDSTFGSTKALFIDELPIPAENVHPIPTETTLEDSANAYTKTIQKVFGGDLPKLDLIYLGMGPDGHTASLFPDHEITEGTGMIAIERNSPKPPAERLSFTSQLINNAYIVIFLITGEDKAEMVHKILTQGESVNVPAAQISGNVIWLLDDAAGSELKLSH
ncbi:MAG: 6-phosphogluconolactonase [Candidatus Doudnabacteria bacterium]|nr:6-phosphogluconolactonase [Candidatus Doudnabacteria bacterium]